MPEYLSPGVYVEEVETGAVSIEGVSTSTAAFLGRTERGPDEPQFCSSFAEFKRQFGGYAKYRRGEPMDDTTLAYAVDGFFRNGGSRCYVGRITAATETSNSLLGPYESPTELVTDAEPVNFGRVVVDRTVTETVEFEHPGFENDPGIDVAVDVDGGAGAGMYRARLVDEEGDEATVAGGASLVAEVSYTPTGSGPHSATLTLTHRDSGSTVSVDLDGTGVNAADGGELTPSTWAIDFGSVAKNATASGSVTVTNDGLKDADPVTISSVTLDTGNAFSIDNSSAFSQNVEVPVGESATIEIALTPGSGKVSDTLSVTHTASNSDIKIDLRGHVVEPANTLGSSATKVDFGTVPKNTTAGRTVSVRNMGGPGDDDLLVKGASAGNAEASAKVLGPSSNPTLAPGESVPVRIEFSPEQTGNRPGTVTVTYRPESATSDDDLDIETTVDDVPEAKSTYARRPESGPIEFGEVPVRSSGTDTVAERVTETVVLSNDGGAGAPAVTIENVELKENHDGEYSLPDDLPSGDPSSAVTLDPDETLEVPVTVTPADASLAEAKLEIGFDAERPASLSSPETIDLTATGVASVADFHAIGPGAWGDRVAVIVRNGPRSKETFDVTVRYWSDVDGTGTTDAETVGSWGEPDVEETFGELVAEEGASNYYETAINSGSNLIEVEPTSTERPANGTVVLDRPADADPLTETEEHENVGLDEYTGEPAEEPRGERSGLAGLDEIDDVSIVSVPDEKSHTGLTDAITTHCEERKDRIAVLQTEQGAEPGDLPPNSAVSEYAALYYPYLEVVDPNTGRQKLVPPGGHVAGIYARSDSEHGVWKAPANETVRGVVDLELPVSKADQERLNPKGVNAIRSFPGRGIRVWGARTTSANPQWKYVNVRRLFLYLEESIDEGTQWAVFESNTEDLWARVRQSVRNFLTTVWREGGLAGSTPEEAFYVKADRTTMTQTQIDNGQLIVEIGVAPVKPAEFVIFRISQWTEGLEGGS